MGYIHIYPDEQRRLRELHEVLESASRLADLRDRAYPLLAGLVAADCGALCTWLPGQRRYDWVGNLPDAWFSIYPEIASHDFVREAVSRSPCCALLDQQMIEPTAKERSLLYQRSRDFSLP